MLKTWFAIAKERGAKEVDGSINGSEFARVGVAMINSCPGCGATVAAYNSYQIAPDDPYGWCEQCSGAEAEMDAEREREDGNFIGGRA